MTTPPEAVDPTRATYAIERGLRVIEAAVDDIGAYVGPLMAAASTALEAVNPELAASHRELKDIWPLTNEDLIWKSVRDRVDASRNPAGASDISTLGVTPFYSSNLRYHAIGDAYSGVEENQRAYFDEHERPPFTLSFMSDLVAWTDVMAEQGNSLLVAADISDHPEGPHISVYSDTLESRSHFGQRVKATEDNPGGVLQPEDERWIGDRVIARATGNLAVILPELVLSA